MEGPKNNTASDTANRKDTVLVRHTPHWWL